MIDFRVAAEKLAGFETADEIADFLGEYNIKAKIEDGTKCALAQWMQQITGEKSVLVSRYTTYFKAPTRDFYVELELAEDTFDHSQAMSDFIEKFDLGGYPKLTR